MRSRTSPVGRVYGRLTVVAVLTADRWRCRCSCGSVVDVWRANVQAKRENTRSCGCLHAERAAAAATTHGATRNRGTTREYRSWSMMKNRCLNPRNPRFASYGGRGIGVCQRWVDSFDSFLADMGPRPSAKHSLDRIDNDGDYTPGNCRWATTSEQNLNRRPRSEWPSVARRRALLQCGALFA